MLEHLCHARGCKVAVEPSRLMCLAHWRMVPRELQQRVWATYVAGQERTKSPSRAWLDAAKAAIQAVWQREQHVIACERSRAEQARDDREVRPRCQAEGCSAERPPQWLMCQKHWLLVPQDLKILIIASVIPAHCGRGEAELVNACREAIRIVAHKEHVRAERAKQLTLGVG